MEGIGGEDHCLVITGGLGVKEEEEGRGGGRGGGRGR